MAANQGEHQYRCVTDIPDIIEYPEMLCINDQTSGTIARIYRGDTCFPIPGMERCDVQYEEYLLGLMYMTGIYHDKPNPLCNTYKIGSGPHKFNKRCIDEL